MNSAAILKQLIYLAKNNKLHHSLLFTGLAADLLKSSAIKLAQAGLCLDNSNNYACGNCHSCKLFLAASHPDFYCLEVEQDANALKVEQIRKLQEFTTYKQQLSIMKWVVIDSANQLNLQSSNALLKTLEEPASNTKFILLATNKMALLPTVFSRCLEVRLNDQSTAIAIDTDSNNVIMDIYNLIVTRTTNIVALAEQWYKHDINNFINTIYKAIHCIILCKQQLITISDSTLSKALSELHTAISNLQAFTILDSVVHYKQILHAGYNPNSQMFFEGFLCKITQQGTNHVY